jgi:hypothetical protein
MTYEIRKSILLFAILLTLLLTSCNLDPATIGAIDTAVKTASFFVSPDGYGLVGISYFQGEQWVVQFQNGALVSGGRASSQSIVWMYELMKQSGWRSTTLAQLPPAAQKMLTIGRQSVTFGGLNGLMLVPVTPENFTLDGLYRLNPVRVQ